jgi:hypothetical protein
MARIKDHYFNDLVTNPIEEPQPEEVEILRMVVADNKEEISYDF